MSAHDGSQTNPIDVASLRERLRRERQATRPVRTHTHQEGPDRWFWWPATIALVLVMIAAFLASALGSVAAEREQGEQHLIRWCVSCHNSIEVQPEVDR